MSLMSIIGCREFEKEIVKVLAEDRTIDRLIVVGNSGSSELVSDLENMGMKPNVFFPEAIPHGLKKSKGFNVLVTLQDVDVYRSLDHMKKEAYEKIKFYGLVSDGILMFYGSCEGIFEDALLDFRNSNFFLELLSSEDGEYLGDNISECFSDQAKQSIPSAELIDKYRKCYKKLKDQILNSKAT